jgi:tetratricopeptide (TPR) repeat protein
VRSVEQADGRGRHITTVARDDIAAFLRTLAQAEERSAEEAWDQAARLWQEVVAGNPVDGRFWTKLAEARYRSRDYAGAIEAGKRAFDLRAGFPAETAYRVAACEALRGERGAALDWLERAFALGYRKLDEARSDADLATIRDDARFRALVGGFASDELSRDDGWRGDFDYLVREIKRRAYDPFRIVSEAKFEAEAETLRQAIPALTDAQIMVGMAKLVGLLGDGHAGVFAGEERRDLQRELPVGFYLFAEGLFVIAAHPRYEELLGAQVLKIGELETNAILTAVEPLICRDGENEFWVKHVAANLVRDLTILYALGTIASQERVMLTVRDREGRIRTIEAAADSVEATDRPPRIFDRPDDWITFAETLPAPLPLYLKNVRTPYWFEYLVDDRVVYFQFNSVRDHPREPLANFGRRLFAFVDDHPVEKLVVDLRWNGGGNTYLEMPLLHELIGSRTINRRGRLFVIIGRRTFSAAQNFATLIDRHTEAIFVGEPTGSAPTFVGETVEFQLPYSKLWANVSDLLWQSGWPTDYRRFLAPTIYTPPTFADYRVNRDAALETILACREHLPGW